MRGDTCTLFQLALLGTCPKFLAIFWYRRKTTWFRFIERNCVVFVSPVDTNECLLRNGHGPCQGSCHNLPGSYTCSCEGIIGTRLAADKHTCQDVDECAHNNAGCSHACLNTLGRAFCLCPAGFMLGTDWKTCHGKTSYHRASPYYLITFKIIFWNHVSGLQMKHHIPNRIHKSLSISIQSS